MSERFAIIIKESSQCNFNLCHNYNRKFKLPIKYFISSLLKEYLLNNSILFKAKNKLVDNKHKFGLY